MSQADSKNSPVAEVASTPLPFNLRNFILSGMFVPYAVFSAIGVAVVIVIGSIAFNAFKNHGLIPPPNTLDRYECKDSNRSFTFYYLHGAERVKLESSQGIIEGTVHQNKLDWGSFAGDATQLGFLAPIEISFEDSTSMRFEFADSTALVCSISAKHVGDRRAIVR